MKQSSYILLFFLIFFIFQDIQIAEAQARARYNRRNKSNVTQIGTYPRKGIYLDGAYFFGSNTVSSAEAKASTQNSFLDVKLGYINGGGYYYGGQYTFKNNKDDTSRSEGRGSGFGVGYYWISGFDVRGYYRFHESYGNYRDGSGFQVNLGYSARLTPEIFLGVLVDYREINFKLYTQDPTVRSTVMRTLQPAVTIGYSFRWP